MTRPNIVFIVTDDQRFDTIAALGNRKIRTPNMDWLVRNGTAFTHAFIPGGTSGAVCMPSRAMLHTGRTLFHIQDAGQTIPPEHITLGETFRAAGYTTFGIGKWHNGTDSYHRSFSGGAEIFFGGMADHWNVPLFDYDPTGRYDKRCVFIENPFASNQTKERFCDHIHAGCHSTDIIAAAGVEFLRKQPGDKPYLLYLSFLAPHDPRSMPREFLEMYDPSDIELPPNFLPAHPFDNGDLNGRDEKLSGFPRREAEIRRHVAEYYGMISHMDDGIGRVIEAVRRRGDLERTIFVLCGDNGIAIGQHGLMGKQNLYEHSVRVPLVFCGPGIPPGKTSDGFAYLLDVFPTLCGLTGLDVPPSVEGRSLVPAMLSGATARDTVYLAYREFQRGVRTRQYKLIEYMVEGKRAMPQLFNVMEDAWETRNLAGDPAFSKVLGELRHEMYRMRDEWDDMKTEWGRTFWEGYERR